MNEQYTPPKPPEDDLIEIIKGVEPDVYGRTIATEEQRARIIAALEQLGLTAEPQTDESIEQGITDARWLVETSEAVRTLKDHPFIDEESLGIYLERDFPTVSIDFPISNPIFLAWDKLDGAHDFASWQGRGSNGSGGVAAATSSLHKVFDFATRDTQLPPIEAHVILTPEGPITLAGTSHRAAAAILRNEIVRCDFLKVIDARAA